MNTPLLASVLQELRERARRSVSGKGWDVVSLRFEAVLREAIGAVV
jgi:hypothetical protein